jgi:phosphatidylethanolamine-binding protein (PEBP) family uncharacterized protein
MKKAFFLVLIVYHCMSLGCSDVSSDAVELTVDFTWRGLATCSWSNPEINIGNVPQNTKFLVISMYDHAYFYDHGEVKINYDGTGIIKRGAIKELYAPCPYDTPGQYEITVKALDKDDVVIGIGSKERYYPEKK